MATLLSTSILDLFPPDAVNAQYTPRSAGLHVSTIVRSLCSQVDPKRYPPVGTGRPASDLRLLIGLLFEDMLGDALAGRYLAVHPGAFRPGELTQEGIIGTPDLVIPIDADATTLAVVECKATWLSSFEFDPESAKAQYWLWQLKTYACLLGLDVGELWVLFLMGDYRFDKSTEPGPHFRRWRFTFTARELTEHWQMIAAHADWLRRKGYVS